MTELVDVSDSNPDAHGRVSSNLTSRTKYRTGVMGAHLALTQEDEDRNLGAVPKQICRMMSAGADTGPENRGQQKMLWGSTPPSCAIWSDTLTGKEPPR